MKNLAFIFIFFGLMVSAQNRAIYEYKYKIDSTKLDSLKTEWMYLDITKEGSKYYSKKAFDRDSISAEAVRKQIASGSRSISVSRHRDAGDVEYEVQKTYPDFKTFITTSIDNDRYKVLEDRPFNWKIFPEKQKIGEFEAQKAKTIFAGRQWTVWFTTDVPFQDGPYKFHGLPGLIIKAEDKTKTHVMELKALKPLVIVKQEDVNAPDGKAIPFLTKKPIEISRSQYAKQLQQYRNDPVKGMREMLNQPNSKVAINVNGQEYTEPAEVLRQLEKSAKEELQKTNNQIELKN